MVWYSSYKRLDGIVPWDRRTTLATAITSEEIVNAYKQLKSIKTAFRSLKDTDEGI